MNVPILKEAGNQKYDFEVLLIGVNFSHTLGCAVFSVSN